MNQWQYIVKKMSWMFPYAPGNSRCLFMMIHHESPAKHCEVQGQPSGSSTHWVMKDMWNFTMVPPHSGLMEMLLCGKHTLSQARSHLACNPSHHICNSVQPYTVVAEPCKFCWAFSWGFAAKFTPEVCESHAKSVTFVDFFSLSSTLWVERFTGSVCRLLERHSLPNEATMNSLGPFLPSVHSKTQWTSHKAEAKTA
jgi:hypothetical protein